MAAFTALPTDYAGAKSELLASRVTIGRQQAETKQLRQRVKELEACKPTENYFELACFEYRQQLAASQLDNLRLRSALEYHQEQTRPIQGTIEALSTTTDTEALEKYVAERIESHEIEEVSAIQIANLTSRLETLLVKYAALKERKL